MLGVPDLQWGETGVAFVALKPDATFDAAALTRHCVAQLAKFKCPSRIIAVPAIPRSGAGKILKPVLRERLNRGDLA